MLIACQAPIPDPTTQPVVALPTLQLVSTNTPTPLPTRTPAPLRTQDAQRDVLTIPIAVYILDDVNEGESSARTVEEVAEIYERVNVIWSQADITLEVLTIERVTVSAELLEAITQRNFFSFFAAVNQRVVDLPQFAPIVGFYVKELGGPNGINPSSSNIFFVMDEPSVFDERVTSHEIGHILGLHHELDDAGRLMFSGTNGTELTEEEQLVARYSATGLLSRVR